MCPTQLFCQTTGFFFFFQLTAEGAVNCCALAGMIARLHVADDGGLHCFFMCVCVRALTSLGALLLQDLISLSCVAAVFNTVFKIKALIVFLPAPAALRSRPSVRCSFGSGRRSK